MLRGWDKLELEKCSFGLQKWGTMSRQYVQGGVINGPTQE
jgi:hypothetical protein